MIYSINLYTDFIKRTIKQKAQEIDKEMHRLAKEKMKLTKQLLKDKVEDNNL